MWRFLLPALAMMGAMTALIFGAVGDLWLSPDLSNGGSAIISHAAPEQVAPPASSPSPVPLVSAPTSAMLKEVQARDAVQRQIGDLQQQATSLQGGIADLQRQDSALQTQIAQHKKQIAQRAAETSAVAEQQTTHDTLQRQVAGLQRQIADLQRQDGSIQSQIAQHRQELAQSSQDLAQRSQELAKSTEALTQQTRDLDAVRAETDKLRQGIDRLREQRQAEEASLARQKPPEQLAAVTPPRPATAKPAPRTAQPLPVRQPTQSTSGPQPGQPIPAPQPSQGLPAPQPTQLMPAASAAQQLQTARQWLSAGRPDEARRILAMVQTQMVFQPVTPDQPSAQGGNPSATDIGDAIRWLDMGASGPAMQSITRAIGNANPPAKANVAGNTRAAGGPVRAWSGFTADTPSGAVLPPAVGVQQR
jgi:hypothetical protein